MEHSIDSKPITFRIQGMDCPDCAASLEKAVRALPEVASAELSFATAKLVVTPSDGQKLAGQDSDSHNLATTIVELAASMGYGATIDRPMTGQPVPSDRNWRTWLRTHRRDATVALAAILMLLAFVWQLSGGLVLVSRVLYSVAIVVGGFYIARAGWTALRTSKSLDMNVLMTIAAVGAMAVGEVEEGAVTVLLFSLGELLENYSLDKARNAVRTLMDLAPAVATVVREDGQVRMPVGEVQIGEQIVVLPGERLPMDGRILQGRSAVNQAPITGESIPVDKAPGDEVYAGAINGNGALTVEVTRLAQDNTLSRIARLVEEAQGERASSQRFVDRFARVYTPIVVGLAVLVAVLPPLLGLGLLSTWFYRALVLLVIACPCALVISTPVTIVSALARAARSGVLIKGGRYLEALARLRVMALDKTGTLTEGKPYVVGGGCELHRGEAMHCSTCEDLVAKAAAVELRSEHALGRAVTDYAGLQGLSGRYAPSDEVTAFTGLGIEGLVAGHKISVGSHAFCHRNGGAEDEVCAAVAEAENQGYTVLVLEDECCKNRCYLSISDKLREGVPETIQALKRAGIERTVMLTGDNRHIAQLMAKKAGIDEVHGELLPEDKVRVVEDLERQYGQVAMVGDGVNDAPALARATVGIAMGVAGTDTALETADVALMSDDLGRLPFALRLSRRALAIVRTNVAFALIVKAVFLTLAVAGVATLWMAVIADVGASLVVILNGLRMLGFRDRLAS